MRDLSAFRDAVRRARSRAGRTQRDLAKAVALHPDVLSHKLRGHGAAVLTGPEVIAIVRALAGWGALSSRAEAESMLEAMQVPGRLLPGDVLPVQSQPSAQVRAGSGAGFGARRVRTTGVPAPAVPLIGREEELRTVLGTVVESRLVTLTGVAGTGKTQLARHAAYRLAGDFRDGAAFVELAPLRDSSQVGLAMALAVGLSPVSADVAEQQLVDAVREARLLLVLDNMEHLPTAGALLARVLSAAPGLHLLATSRAPLSVYGEQQLKVPPLQLPPACRTQVAAIGGAGPRGAASDGELRGSPAVQLFIERARAVARGFDPQGPELAAVADVCRLLDGLPLAIELAAARTRRHRPSALLPLLSDRVAYLSSGGVPSESMRKHTLRTTLEWSESLLPAPAVGLFARLGVFAGSFDAAAATAVCGDGDGVEQMLERLSDLAEHNLVELTSAATPRFRMLQVIRNYAAQRLRETGEADTVRLRHLHHYLGLATSAHPSLYGPGQGEQLARLESDIADLGAALDWSLQRGGEHPEHLDAGLRLAIAVALVWHRRALLAPSAQYLTALLALDAQVHAVSPAVRRQALLEAAALACFRGDYPATMRAAAEALALTEVDPSDGAAAAARAHRYLAEAALAVGDLATAEPHVRQQLAYAESADDLDELADAHNMMGHLRRFQGDVDEAASQLGTARDLWSRAGDPDGVACALEGLAELARDLKDGDRTAALSREALRLHWLAGNVRAIALDLECLAAGYALQGRGRPALVLAGAAQVLREERSGPLPPADRALLDRVLAPTTAQLNGDEREAALAESRQPLARIVERALAGAGDS